MGTRSIAWGVSLLFVVALGRVALADPKGEITQKSKEAMESYDLMDYDAAKKALGQALASAKKGKLEKDPLVAKVYVNLGIVAFAAGDQDGARAAFAAATAIDPKIQIEAAYKSPDLVKLLDSARNGGGGGASGGGGGTVSEPVDPGVDCSSVKGFQHTIIDTGKGGTALPLEVLVGSDLVPARVSIQYRAKEKPEFTEVKMTKQGSCKYVGKIPGNAMRGSLLFYYVAAYDANNHVIGSKGTSGAPNTMDIEGGENIKAGSDDEDPINGNKKKQAKQKKTAAAETKGGEVTATGTSKPKQQRVYVAIAAGTSAGYVTGTTEANNPVQTCCIGTSLVVLTPELGFNANKQLSIGVMGRIGLPIGANVDPPMAKHSTVAPGGVIRVRYALSPEGEGLRLMGQVGGGVMRNTIKIEGQGSGMDTDIVAQGPLLVGGGIGFTKKLASAVAFVADASVLAGIAVVDKIGTARLNTGVGADLTLGIAFGF